MVRLTCEERDGVIQGVREYLGIAASHLRCCPVRWSLSDAARRGLYKLRFATVVPEGEDLVTAAESAHHVEARLARDRVELILAEARDVAGCDPGQGLVSLLQELRSMLGEGNMAALVENLRTRYKAEEAARELLERELERVREHAKRAPVVERAVAAMEAAPAAPRAERARSLVGMRVRLRDTQAQGVAVNAREGDVRVHWDDGWYDEASLEEISATEQLQDFARGFAPSPTKP